jgi:hypothetical protein
MANSWQPGTYEASPLNSHARLATTRATSAHSRLIRKLRRSFCLGRRAEYGSAVIRGFARILTYT